MSKKPLLLVVAFDGLRHDFINKENTPNLLQLAQKGLWADQGIQSVFPSDTMPNFYAISSGLYADNSGVIGNKFYDPSFKQQYVDWFAFTDGSDHFDDCLSAKWYNGTPLWNLNEEQGGRSGCLYWPCGDAAIGGRRPTFYEHFNGIDGDLSTWSADLDRVLSWFTLTDPVNLAFFFINEPDETQHGNDIYGDNVKNKIKELDQFVGVLLQRISDSNVLRDRLNLVLLSDHGHENIRFPDNIIDIMDAISPDIYEKLIWTGQSVFPRDETVDMDKVYGDLTKAVKENGWELSVYRKSDVPERLHYKNNPRIGPIVIYPNLGYCGIECRPSDAVIFDFQLGVLPEVSPVCTPVPSLL